MNASVPILMAGAASIDITPPLGVPLVGMERRSVSWACRDRLVATAVALSFADQIVLLIAADLLAIHHGIVAAVRERLAAHRVSAVLVSASHNHSGPPTYAFADSPYVVREYVATLPDRLAQVAIEAIHARRPTSLAVGDEIVEIGINRRPSASSAGRPIAGNQAGAIDHELIAWALDGIDGQPIATIVNVACHPVVFGNESNAISADWPGVLRARLEQSSGAPSLFLQGAAGDINPLPGVPTDDPADAEAIGARVAEAALSARDKATPVIVDRLEAVSQVVELSFLDPARYESSPPEPVELRGYLADLDRKGIESLFHDWMPWGPSLVGSGSDRRGVVEIQVVRVGSAAIVGLSVEPFSTTGLAIKRLIPGSLMVAGYANGMLGYVPMPEDYAIGGYEVEEAHLFYQTPGPVATDSAIRLVDAAADLLRQTTTSAARLST